MTKEAESPAMTSIAAGADGPLTPGETDKPAKRRFDDSHLTPLRALSASDVRALREREGATQAVFARYLNVTPGLIHRWETGERRPFGAALKLLLLVRRHGLDAIA